MYRWALGRLAAHLRRLEKRVTRLAHGWSGSRGRWAIPPDRGETVGDGPAPQTHGSAPTCADARSLKIKY
jgi:hypothetical protein